MLCPLGALTLGFVPAKVKFLDGSFRIPLWLKDQDARAIAPVNKLIEVLSLGFGKLFKGKIVKDE